MSDAISALPGMRYRGMVDLAEGGLRGMITLRGDLASTHMAKALHDATGAAMPAQRRVTTGARGAIAWMSPDELLVMVEHAQVAEIIAALETALEGEFASVADVSDARAVFTLSGAQSCDVLAKICPVDFTSFEIGEIRRTRAAQVAAAVWREGESAFTLVCFRSVARYMADLLCAVSAPGGEVGLYHR